MMELFGLNPEETKILVVGVAGLISLLLVGGIYFWIRQLLRAWVKRTCTTLDDRILVNTEYSLLPLLALGVVYVLFSFVPLSLELVVPGQRILMVVMTVVALVAVTRFILSWLEKLGERYGLTTQMARVGHGPIRAIAFVSVLYVLSTYFLDLSEVTEATLRPILRASLILFSAWLLMRGLMVAGQLVWQSYRRRVEDIDPQRARSFETLIGIAQYVASFIVVVIAGGAALSQFTFFQTLAGSLLASAGVAGLVLGLAAQRSLGNVFAGIQLALTQPVRLEDVVVFEGEAGVIEEVSLSHVVIRLWDLRRLIVPIAYLLDRPIQNWTRTAPELIGLVHIYADYQVDVGAVRQELDRILHSTPLWDRKTPPILEVTGCKQDTIELRARCSAANPSSTWDLECFVREKLVAYLQTREAGTSLPRTRVELKGSLPSTFLERFPNLQADGTHPIPDGATQENRQEGHHSP